MDYDYKNWSNLEESTDDSPNANYNPYRSSFKTSNKNNQNDSDMYDYEISQENNDFNDSPVVQQKSRYNHKTVAEKELPRSSVDRRGSIEERTKEILERNKVKPSLQTTDEIPVTGKSLQDDYNSLLEGLVIPGKNLEQESEEDLTPKDFRRDVINTRSSKASSAFDSMLTESLDSFEISAADLEVGAFAAKKAKEKATDRKARRMSLDAPPGFKSSSSPDVFANRRSSNMSQPTHSGFQLPTAVSSIQRSNEMLESYGLSQDGMARYGSAENSDDPIYKMLSSTGLHQNNTLLSQNSEGKLSIGSVNSPVIGSSLRPVGLARAQSRGSVYSEASGGSEDYGPESNDSREQKHHRRKRDVELNSDSFGPHSSYKNPPSIDLIQNQILNRSPILDQYEGSPVNVFKFNRSSSSRKKFFDEQDEDYSNDFETDLNISKAVEKEVVSTSNIKNVPNSIKPVVEIHSAEPSGVEQIMQRWYLNPDAVIPSSIKSEPIESISPPVQPNSSHQESDAPHANVASVSAQLDTQGTLKPNSDFVIGRPPIYSPAISLDNQTEDYQNIENDRISLQTSFQGSEDLLGLKLLNAVGNGSMVTSFPSSSPPIPSHSMHISDKENPVINNNRRNDQNNYNNNEINPKVINSSHKPVSSSSGKHNLDVFNSDSAEPKPSINPQALHMKQENDAQSLRANNVATSYAPDPYESNNNNNNNDNNNNNNNNNEAMRFDTQNNYDDFKSMNFQRYGDNIALDESLVYSGDEIEQRNNNNLYPHGQEYKSITELMSSTQPQPQILRYDPIKHSLNNNMSHNKPSNINIPIATENIDKNHYNMSEHIKLREENSAKKKLATSTANKLKKMKEMNDKSKKPSWLLATDSWIYYAAQNKKLTNERAEEEEGLTQLRKLSKENERLSRKFHNLEHEISVLKDNKSISSPPTFAYRQKSYSLSPQARNYSKETHGMKSTAVDPMIIKLTNENVRLSRKFSNLNKELQELRSSRQSSLSPSVIHPLTKILETMSSFPNPSISTEIKHNNNYQNKNNSYANNTQSVNNRIGFVPIQEEGMSNSMILAFQQIVKDSELLYEQDKLLHERESAINKAEKTLLERELLLNSKEKILKSNFDHLSNTQQHNIQQQIEVNHNSNTVTDLIETENVSYVQELKLNSIIDSKNQQTINENMKNDVILETKQQELTKDISQKRNHDYRNYDFATTLADLPIGLNMTYNPNLIKSSNNQNQNLHMADRPIKSYLSSITTSIVHKKKPAEYLRKAHKNKVDDVDKLIDKEKDLNADNNDNNEDENVIKINKSSYNELLHTIEQQDLIINNLNQENNRISQLLKEREMEEKLQLEEFNKRYHNMHMEINNLRFQIHHKNDSNNYNNNNSNNNRSNDIFISGNRNVDKLSYELEMDTIIRDLKDRLKLAESGMNNREKDLRILNEKYKAENYELTETIRQLQNFKSRIEKESQEDESTNFNNESKNNSDPLTRTYRLIKQNDAQSKIIEELNKKIQWFTENQQLIENYSSKLYKIDLDFHIIKNDLLKYVDESYIERLLQQQKYNIPFEEEKTKSPNHNNLKINQNNTNNTNNNTIYSKHHRSMADIKKIKELEGIINDLKDSMLKRNPDSIASLIRAAADDSQLQKKSKQQELLIKQLKEEIDNNKESYELRLRSLRQEYERMKIQYDHQIQELQKQLLSQNNNKNEEKQVNNYDMAEDEIADRKNISSIKSLPQALNRIKQTEEEMNRMRSFYLKKIDDNNKKYEHQIRSLKRNSNNQLPPPPPPTSIPSSSSAKNESQQNEEMKLLYENKINSIQQKLDQTTNQLQELLFLNNNSNHNNNINDNNFNNNNISPSSIQQFINDQIEQRLQGINNNNNNNNKESFSVPLLSPSDLLSSQLKKQQEIISMNDLIEQHDRHTTDITIHYQELLNEQSISHQKEMKEIILQLRQEEFKSSQLFSELNILKDRMQRMPLTPDMKQFKNLENHINQLEMKLSRREQDLVRAMEEGKSMARVERSRLEFIHEQ
eukprot:gene7352-10023_t